MSRERAEGRGVAGNEMKAMGEKKKGKQKQPI